MSIQFSEERRKELREWLSSFPKHGWTFHDNQKVFDLLALLDEKAEPQSVDGCYCDNCTSAREKPTPPKVTVTREWLIHWLLTIEKQRKKGGYAALALPVENMLRDIGVEVEE